MWRSFRVAHVVKRAWNGAVTVEHSPKCIVYGIDSSING